MAKQTKTKGDFEILIPRRGAAARGAAAARDPSVRTQAVEAWTVEKFFDVEQVDTKQMADDWREKLSRLVDVAAGAAPKDKAWHIDEIEIGLALSAKGKLMFIAEAGAEASVKVTLKRT